MQQIPLQAVPSQQLQVTLGGQLCSLTIYVKTQCMFMDLTLNGVIILQAARCLNMVSMVPTSYLGFTGQIMFFDTQGTSDPVFTGLGARWILLYLSASDMEAYGIAA